MIKKPDNAGFMAVISVVMLALAIQAFSVTVFATVSSYLDSVGRRELRLQTNLNADSCLDTVAIMAAKDYFIQGVLDISAFRCRATIVNYLNGSYSVDVTTELGGVEAHKSRLITI